MMMMMMISLHRYLLRSLPIVLLSFGLLMYLVIHRKPRTGDRFLAREHLRDNPAETIVVGAPTGSETSQKAHGIQYYSSQEGKKSKDGGGSAPVATVRALGKPKEGKKYLLIYNNVPKCGSRSLANTIKNSFKYRRMNDVNVESFNKRNSTVLKEAFENVTTPAYISGHMPFVPLKRADAVYINLVRDPVERFLSLYYFAINGDENGVKPGARNVKNVTIDEYVRNGGTIHTHIFYHFIEDTLDNRNLRQEDALQQSKGNIERYYTLVGITEELLNTMKLLEKLLPDVFPTIHRQYKQQNKDRKQGYSTLHKIPASNETLSILRRNLKLEYDLYYFVKERFNRLKKKFKINHK